MVFALIISILICFFCFLWTIIAIKDKEIGAAIFLFFLTFLSGILCGVIIDAIHKDNEQLIEYRFPASHYTLQEEVIFSHKTIYIDGVEAVEETRDTTYVLTGIEPIIIKENNYERSIKK